MSVVGNVGTYLWDSYTRTSSNKEDLVDWIANIDPYETPLTVLLGKTRAKSTFHQWQKENLRARNTRGIPEGNDWALSAQSAPSRLSNICEIFGEDLGVTESQRQENPAGFGDAYTHILEKATKSTMVDIETALMASSTSATGTSGVPRVMKTLNDFITGNKYTGASYTVGTTTGVVGDATHAGVFSIQDVNRMLNDIWDDGGNTDLLVMNGVYKRQFSAFTTSNTRNVLASEKKVYVAIDVYDSDFGLVPIQLNRWSPIATNTASASTNATDISGRVWFLQRSQIRLAWFRDLQHRLMGTRGDSVAGQVRGELTLEVGNQDACGVFTGVNNKSSVT